MAVVAAPLPPGVDAACAGKSPALDRGTPLGGASSAAQSRDIMGPYFGGGFGFQRLAAPPPAARSANDAPVELEITGPATRSIADPIDLHLAMTNKSMAPIVVARPLDGSLEHWRYPTYDLYARDEGDGSVWRFAFSGARCGNVNAIAKDDFVTLAPKQRKTDVGDNGWAEYLHQARLPKPGRYTVWVVYSYCGYGAGGVPLGADVRRSDVHVGVHASNALTVTVRAK